MLIHSQCCLAKKNTCLAHWENACSSTGDFLAVRESLMSIALTHLFPWYKSSSGQPGIFK